MSMGTLPSRMGTEQFLLSCLVTVSSIIFEDANADVDAKCEWALKAYMHYTIRYSIFRMVNASKVEINNFISVWLHFSDKYPDTYSQECRCYVNPHERALVADCAHAGLTQIPKSLPIDTDWLILSGNNISSIQTEDLKFLPILSRLNLKQNKIKSIPQDFAEYLISRSNAVNLSTPGNETRKFESAKVFTQLSLSQNQFECTCDNLWMKNWLIKNRGMVQDYDAVDCEMESGRRVPFIELTHSHHICPSMLSLVLNQILHI